jgi:hypothetical protein
MLVSMQSTPPLGPRKSLPESDLPTASTVPVKSALGQTILMPALLRNALLEVIETVDPVGVITACAGIGATASRPAAARSRRQCVTDRLIV